MINKRKTSTSIIAAVTALALLVGGTFAWTSISQEATNESAGTVNVGGRLHDDFNGTNKDVYVENFTDPLNGGQPIYARVMLTEYMEVGQDAGGIDDGDNIPEAVPVVDGTDIDDVTTWKPHVPSASCAECDTAGTCVIHEHWTWVMGNDEAKVFMPTFNKDKDSLAADINGTYPGTNPNDKIYYDNYVTYVTAGGVVVDMINNTVDGTPVTIPADATDGSALTEANQPVTSVTGNAQYDNDPDTDPNVIEIDDYILKEETHHAKETPTAEVITMADWLKPEADGGKGGQPGNFWVYDTDGWAYWANPIMPGEATGLLLSNIQMTSNPGEKCYYAINVIGQFATVNDWTSFDKGGVPSDEAQQVLTAASNNVPTVTVSNVSGVTSVEQGGTYDFDANVTVNGVAMYSAADANFQWSVLDENMNEITEGTTINSEGVLTVSADEASSGLIVVARSSDYSGAVGFNAVAVLTLSDKINAITPGSTTTITVDGMDWYVLAKEGDKALIWAKDVIPAQEVTFGTTDTTNKWSGSAAQSYLNGDYFNSLNVLKEHVLPTKIYTADAYDRSGSYAPTTDNVFLLTEADVFGTVEGTEATNAKEFTLGVAGSIVPEDLRGSSEYNWLRSPRQAIDEFVAVLHPAGSSDYSLYSNPGYLRPAMWVELEVPTPETEEVVDEDLKDIAAVTPGSEETVNIDGIDWYVLAKEDGQVLLWAADVINDADGTPYSTTFGTNNIWKDSLPRTYLNGTFLDSLATLGKHVAQPTFNTADIADRSSGTYITSNDKVFLLSEADVFGTVNGTDTTEPQEYTLGKSGIIVTTEMLSSSQSNWLRSPKSDNSSVAILDNNNGSGSDTALNPYYLRPAMWVKLAPVDNVAVTEANDTTAVESGTGTTLQFTAAVTKNGNAVAEAYQGVTWSVSGGNGTAKIDKNGVLTVDTSEPAGTLTVKATSTADNSVFGEWKVALYTVSEELQTLANTSIGGTVTIDETDWYVLAKENGKALIWAADVIPDYFNSFGSDNIWRDSNPRTYLNGTYLNTLTVLKKHVAETTIYTAYNFDRSATENGIYYTTTDKVFLLTEADVFGTANGTPTSDENEYTYGNEALVTEAMKKSSGGTYNWLRSPREESNSAAILFNDGTGSFAGYQACYYLRPAMWVNLATDYKVTVTAANDATVADPGTTLQFTANVTKDGNAMDEADQGVTWEVIGSSAGSTISETGELTVSANEPDDTVLTIRATSTAVGTVFGEAEVTVGTVPEELKTLANTSIGGTVTIDNAEWYVLAKRDGKALIWAADVIKGTDGNTTKKIFGSTNQWSGSAAQTYLNGTFLDSRSTLQEHVAVTTIYTADTYNRTGSYIETTDKVFLLSEADLVGIANYEITIEPKEYTLGEVGVIVTEKMLASSDSNLLRSPRAGDTYVALLTYEAEISNSDNDTTRCLRPAMWIDLTS